MKSTIFNQHQVNHALKNKEGMFRVVCKVQPNNQNQRLVYMAYSTKVINKRYWAEIDEELNIKNRTDYFKLPFEVGEEIFVKETFCVVDDTEYGGEIWIDYRATPEYAASHPAGWDNEPDSPDALKWKPAQHMKQEHSRLTLRIKSVKVERLQDISCAQCFLETGLRPSVVHMDLDCDTPNPKDDFRTLWNSTHKKPEEKFEANPFCFAYEYEVI